MDPRHHQTELESGVIGAGDDLPAAERADELESGGSVDTGGSGYDQPGQTAVIASVIAADTAHLRPGGSETSVNPEGQDQGLEDSIQNEDEDLDEEARIRRDLDRRPSFRYVHITRDDADVITASMTSSLSWNGSSA
jgi:hypothetical protein